MCTLIVLDRVVPGFPLVIGSNRDEYYSRASATPARLNAQTENGENGNARPPIVAPQDLLAGGTWMGINGSGLFVGLTNRKADKLDPAARSRGQLVFDALASSTAEQAREAVGPMHGHEHNPYFLLMADGQQSWLVSDREWTEEPLQPGIHVVGNLPPEHPESERVYWIRERAESLPRHAGLKPLFEGLKQILASHIDVSNPREGACVHTPLFGTRSSTLIALGEERWELQHAEGPACEAKFRDLSRLTEELRTDTSWRDAGASETHEESIRNTGHA